MARQSTIPITVLLGMLMPAMIPAFASSVPDEPAAALAGVDSKPFRVDLGADLVTTYWWRGYNIEDSGLIIHSYVEFIVPVVPVAEGQLGIDAFIGNWNSVHSHRTEPTGRGPRAFYETDLYAGLSLTFDRLSIRTAYYFEFYPSISTNSDDRVDEVELTVTLDLPDDQWLGRWLGDPSVSVWNETHNSNVNADTDQASYLEINFGPSFEICDGKATISVPATLGLSLKDFYVDSSGNDRTFGFFSVGLDLAVPLNEDRTLTLTAGVAALFLNGATRESNNNESVGAVGHLLLTYSY